MYKLFNLIRLVLYTFSPFCKTNKVLKYEKIIYVGSLLFFTLTSCKDSKTVNDATVVYTPEVLESVETIKLHPNLVSTDFSFSRPKQMDFITDSLIMVYDEIENKNVGQVLTRSGKHKGQFGVIGKGNGEMLLPEVFSIGKDKHSIYFFDIQMHRSLKYNIKDVLSNKNVIKTLKSPTSDGENEYFAKKILYISDTDFIVLGYDNRLRIQSVKDGKVTDTYT